MAVAIHTTNNFNSYKSGVFHDTNCNRNKIDHAVNVVGYGRDARFGDFWLVRNSWGTGWGEQGYIRMARNKGDLCGLGSFAMYPTSWRNNLHIH